MKDTDAVAAYALELGLLDAEDLEFVPGADLERIVTALPVLQTPVKVKNTDVMAALVVLALGPFNAEDLELAEPHIFITSLTCFTAACSVL